MTTAQNKLSRRHQQGAALLLIMLAVVVATSTVLLATLSRDDLYARQLRLSQFALSQAKAALINYAVVNPDLNPGNSFSLPCPDIDETGGFADGEAHATACGARGVSVIGRLPWRTLGVPALKDAASACLWYVVSGSYKEAGVETAAMINADSNGQLQLLDIDSAAVIEGLAAQDRPVAMILAPMQPLSTQTRPGYAAGSACVPGANSASYLDADTASGINNAALSGVPDALDILGIAAGYSEDHNDRISTISRADIERRVVEHGEHLIRMRNLGLTVAACIANYGANNPGGPNDKRLPWPAPVAMADYRLDASYDDANTGFGSGRLVDISNDSNLSTGNSISRVLSDCDVTAVPTWTALQRARWQHWKDHFFYAVSGAHNPISAVPSSCGSCLTVNGSGQYAAIIIFANSRLSGIGQVRNAPPMDTDTKMSAGNYLEGLNATNVPGTAIDYRSAAATNNFNDLLFCIDDQLIVTEC